MEPTVYARGKTDSQDVHVLLPRQGYSSSGLVSFFLYQQ